MTVKTKSRRPREGEDPATELTRAGSLIGYVQFADVVGRGEPGSGGIDWPAAPSRLLKRH